MNALRTCLALLCLLVAAAAGAATVGAPAPAFALPDADGRPVALEGLRGQVVYVDFWASWCGPCRRSFPWMNEMTQKYGERGFKVVAINVDRKRADAERFLAKVPATFSILFDPTGATPGAWEIKGMPSSFLIDARGTIVQAEHGFDDAQKAALETQIRALLPAR